MKRFLTVLAAVVFVSTLSAQVMTGRLEGTVTDSQGAGVPGAEVKVLNTQTGQNLTVSADERGFWALPSLPSAAASVK